VRAVSTTLSSLSPQSKVSRGENIDGFLSRFQKECHFCGQDFCSHCIGKVNGRTSLRRTCSMCQVIEDDRSTDEDLMKIRTKHLRAYLIHSTGVSRERLLTFAEKEDLVRVVRTRNRSEVIVEPTPNIVVVEPPIVPTREFVRLTLDELSSLDSIEGLTIRQLKDLLRQNFVSIKGCLEKGDLIDKVQLLFQDHQQSHEPGKDERLLLRDTMRPFT
jgi:hypothetical protein